MRVNCRPTTDAETETRFWALLEAAWTRRGPDADQERQDAPAEVRALAASLLMLADTAQRASD
jgi:hypothetical protein